MTLTNLKISAIKLLKKKKWKNSTIWSYWKPLVPGLKLKIQLLAEFCPPSVWYIKFADTHEQLESLCVKPTTQSNLKHKAPSVRALILPSSFFLLTYWNPASSVPPITHVTNTDFQVKKVWVAPYRWISNRTFAYIPWCTLIWGQYMGT